MAKTGRMIFFINGCMQANAWSYALCSAWLIVYVQVVSEVYYHELHPQACGLFIVVHSPWPCHLAQAIPGYINTLLSPLFTTSGPHTAVFMLKSRNRGRLRAGDVNQATRLLMIPFATMGPTLLRHMLHLLYVCLSFHSMWVIFMKNTFGWIHIFGTDNSRKAWKCWNDITLPKDWYDKKNLLNHQLWLFEH